MLIRGCTINMHRVPVGAVPDHLTINLVQKVLETYLSPSLPMRKYYQASSDAMHGKTFGAGFRSPLPVPSAFLYSDADTVTVSDDIRTVTAKWRASGSDVEEVEFEGTKHVMHLQSFPEPYERAVANVIRKALGEAHACP